MNRIFTKEVKYGLPILLTVCFFILLSFAAYAAFPSSTGGAWNTGYRLDRGTSAYQVALDSVNTSFWCLNNDSSMSDYFVPTNSSLEQNAFKFNRPLGIGLIDGKCCVSNYETRCYYGDVYYFDSCGNMQEKKEDCYRCVESTDYSSGTTYASCRPCEYCQMPEPYVCGPSYVVNSVACSGSDCIWLCDYNGDTYEGVSCTSRYFVDDCGSAENLGKKCEYGAGSCVPCDEGCDPGSCGVNSRGAGTECKSAYSLTCGYYTYWYVAGAISPCYIQR